MPIHVAGRRVPTRVVAAAVVGVPALAVLVIGAAYLIEGEWARRSPPGAIDAAPRHEFTVNVVDGVERPEATPGAAANLPDDEPVIGVLAGGKARAYRLAAFDAFWRHVVNDAVGDVPVTVTYCPADHCTQVFTGPARTQPLDIGVGGRIGTKMVLRVHGATYDQSTGRLVSLAIPETPENKPTEPASAVLPYPTHPFTKTSWKQWRDAHPETDVYLGTEQGPP